MKKKKLKPPEDPVRDPDYIHPVRGTKYWWYPEWTRQLTGGSLGHIRAVKRGDYPVIQIRSRTGNVTDIPGRIGVAYRKWHEDRALDMILLRDEDEWPLEDWE